MVRPSNSAARNIAREMKTDICLKTYTSVFVASLAALFSRPQNRNSPNSQQPMNAYVGVVPTMEYYLATKRNEVLTHATIRVS